MNKGLWKKCLIAGLSALMAGCLSFAVAACAGPANGGGEGEGGEGGGGGGHTHTYTQWEHDGTQHWKVCPDDGAEDPAGRTGHNFVGGECECGATEQPHQHTYDAWDFDDTEHWKYCDEHGTDKSNIDESTREGHTFTEGRCECGATQTPGPVAELDTRDFYVVGKGAGDLKNGTWNGADENFKFTKATQADAEGYTVYTFSMTVYSDDEFKFIEKNAITQGTDDDGNPTYTWNDALVFTYSDLDATTAKNYFKDVSGNIVVMTNADGVYEFTIRTKKNGDMHEKKVTVRQTEHKDPLGIKAQYDMYIVGRTAAKSGCKWPSEYPASTLVADVARYCYHLELQDDGQTFSVLADLRTTDSFKVWNARLGDKDAGYYPTGVGGDLKVSSSGWYVVSWKVGSSTVSITMHTHDYTQYAHGVQGTTQHWKVCSICGAKQAGSDEDHSYGADGTENCVCGVEPGWGDHVHTYSEWKKDIYGHQCWKVCPDDNEIDPENGKEMHDFDGTGTCTRCGSKLEDMVDIYLSASSKLPTEAFLDSVIIGQGTLSNAAPNNPHLVLDPATKTFSVTMWLTAGELWKPWAADTMYHGAVYDSFNWLYRFDTTAKATRSVNNIQLASGQASGVYLVSWVYNAESFTLTPVSDHDHAYDGDTDETCNTCGYVRHFFADNWTQTPTEHYHASTCEHEGLKKDYGLHDFGEDKTCDTCGYTRTADYEFTFEASGEAYVVSGYTFLDPSVTELEIPALHETKPVIGIKDDAFYKESDTTFAGITKVTLPDSLVSLGNNAFRGFTSLATINLDKVTSYGNYALAGTALVSITLPETVTTVGTYLLSDCTSLTSATLPDSLTVIPERMFSGCSALTSQDNLHLGNAVTEFGNNVFYKTGFTTFEIPSTVTKLGTYLFAYSKMESFDFSDLNEAITAVPGFMFQGSTTLTSVTFGDKITSIESAAFNRCTGLKSVTIPAQVKQISYNAFKDSGLTSAKFECPTTGWKLGNPKYSNGTAVTTMNVTVLTTGKVGSTTGGPTKPYFYLA